MRFARPFLILIFSLCLLVFASVILTSCGGESDLTTTLSTAVIDIPAAGLTTTIPTAVITEETATTVSTSEELVQMPFIMGLLEAEADAALVAIGLELDPSVYWTTLPGEWGRLITQGPFVEGSWVPIGTIVPVEVGAEGTIVPDVVGWDFGDAEDELMSRGLGAGVHYVPDLMYSGSVVAQDPPGGRVVQPCSEVQLDVQRFAVELANLVGMTKDEVENYCAGYHLALDIEYVIVSSPKQITRVLSQDPSPGTVLMEYMGTVSVTIGKTPTLSL